MATATVDPTANLKALESLHVSGKRDDINGLIADDLRRRGYAVTVAGKQPEETGAVVTYIDRWMWDITMYLFDLTIQIREPDTGIPLATGNSQHGSLTRKSPAKMVDEVMGNIFKEVEK